MLKQFVWGLGYIDELCQIALNVDPNNATTSHPYGITENNAERFFYALQDANYNGDGKEDRRKRRRKRG